MSIARASRFCVSASLAALALSFGSASANAAPAPDFPTAVTAMHPLAYYRLNATQGMSETGGTTYQSMGGVATAGPGAPVGGNAQFAQLNGKDGYILTTQKGGVGQAATIMAFVDLMGLPSDAQHLFYVAGKSENGNDLDVQFDTDNQLKFWTAAGGHVSYAPPVNTLLNHWHLIVATIDTASQKRVIYWDGKMVASDNGGGRAGKTSAFSLGASTVFGGRFFNGGIEEAALWSRALSAQEVAAIYATVGAGGANGPANAPGAVAAAGAGGGGNAPFATTAKVEAGDAKGPVPLKREEQIAVMFLSSMQTIELNCQLSPAMRACTYNELMSGKITGGGQVSHLKYDPKLDPNYTYVFASHGLAWEAHANAKKPGLISFYWLSPATAQVSAHYNRTGPASPIDEEIGNRSINGDTFDTQ